MEITFLQTCSHDSAVWKSMICNTRSNTRREIQVKVKLYCGADRWEELHSLGLNDQYFQQFAMTLGKWYSFTQLYSASTGVGKHNDGEATLKPLDEQN